MARISDDLRRLAPWWTGILVCVLGTLVSLAAGSLDNERRDADERARVMSELTLARARLDGVIKGTFNSTDGLVHLVSLRGGIDPKLFADMAALAIGKNPLIRNITLAPDDTVAMVYPLAGNEKVLGFDYRSRPEQYRTVVQARERGTPMLVGPLTLVQGGQGLIQRAPIFVADPAGGRRYWGTASIVARLDGLLFPAGRRDNGSIRLAIRGRDGLGEVGEMVTGDPGIFALSPLLMDVEVPGGRWQLAGLPTAGWPRGDLLSSSYFQFGLAVSLLLAWLAGLRTAGAQQVRRRNRALEQEMAERQRAEAALRDEEERFRVLFESSPDPAWIIEGNQFVRCNQAAATIIGVESRAAALAVHPSALSPERQPDGEPSFAKAERMMALAREHGMHRFEWVHRRRDGSEFLAEVTLLAVSMGGRSVIYTVWRDITAARKAENDLKSNQKLLQTIIDSAGAVIYVFDRDGRLLMCNQQFEVAVGHPRAEMLGRRREEFLPPEVAAEHLENDRRVIASGERGGFEEHNIEADGPHYYVTVKCPVYGEGEIVGVVGISTDISDRRKNEERLKLAAAVLRSTGEGVVITDVHSNIVAVNRAFTEITGYEETEVIGCKPSLLKSERQPPAFYEAMWRTLLERDAWQGEIWNRRKDGAIFPEWLAISAIRDGDGAVTHFVGVFSDISTLKHSQQRLEHLAHFDPLTDLPNRALFQDRLAHAIDRAQRYGHQIGVLILDLDGFKTVNDSLGHPVGDQLLVQVARRLQQCIRVEDTVARLGGDEFAVILSSLGDGGDAIEVVRKILASIEQPFDLSGVGAMISTSIGVATFPQDGDSATALVRNADAAMYGAKEGGRNTYRFYQATMTQHAQDRLRREAALRLAIERREFEVWFQPQLHLRGGRLVGAEALVRWRDPERGLVLPGEFIPLAERTGLVLPIGEWVLGEVCRLGRAWLDDGLEFGRLAVNVAAPQIDRGDFVGVLRHALDASGLPPTRLEIEITESLIMASAASARAALQAVRKLGVTTAIDDFGTGHSSLAYLKELPIDKLKIDRAFIKDLPDDAKGGAITRAIVGMAHSLGYAVIAEGIETVEQRDWLHGEGCAEGQGYWFARPLPAAEFATWLREHKAMS